MKVLVILAHPDLNLSRVNKRWMEEIQRQDAEVTVHSLYDAYPDWKIDTKREQELLVAHDRIVFQFPFYWYSAPALLQLWKEKVLTFGWAFGPGGNKLAGKQIMVAVSTGGPAESYQAGGYNNYSMSELLKPFQQLASMIGGTYLNAFVFHGAAAAGEEEIAASSVLYARRIQS